MSLKPIRIVIHHFLRARLDERWINQERSPFFGESWGTESSNQTRRARQRRALKMLNINPLSRIKAILDSSSTVESIRLVYKMMQRCILLGAWQNPGPLPAIVDRDINVTAA